MNPSHVPDGFSTVTPYGIVKNVAAVIEFAEAAFEADVQLRLEAETGAVRHAQLRIGDAMIMLGEAPSAEWTMPLSLYLYVPDCDAVYARALEAGGTSLMEPKDMFYGDRHGGVRDGAGNCWWIATHIEDVDDEELVRRNEAYHRHVDG